MKNAIRKPETSIKVHMILVLLFVLTFSAPVHAQQETPFTGDRVVTVMARNAYSGVDAEIFAVLDSTSLADLLVRVAAVYNGYFARDFHGRASLLAAEIEAKRPALIGLQEALLVRTQFPADGTATPATRVELDYLQILLNALAARGLHYEVVVQSTGFDAELPSALGIDVRHTDREVILVRADLLTADLKLSNAQAGNFVTNCIIPAGAVLPPITIRRGWVAVDAKIRGKEFRFISTHLDGDCLPFTPLIQLAQAAEVVSGPGATTLPLVLVGDLNSPADGTGVTYNSLIASGFGDTWNDIGLGNGFTCCQDPDLLNGPSVLQDRIDFVMYRGPFTTLSAETVGDNPAQKTQSGLWPSDHAGVIARLRLPEPEIQASR